MEEGGEIMAMKFEQSGSPDKHSRFPSDEVPRGSELKSELWTISQQLERLMSILASLQRTRQSGNPNSPFPIADGMGLYSEKCMLEEQIASDAEELKGYMKGLDKEKQRCEKNLKRIQTDLAKLNLQETKGGYLEAIEAQEKQYKEVLDDRDAVLAVLIKAQTILNMSRKSKAPGVNPVGQFSFPAAEPGARPTANPFPPLPHSTEPGKPGGVVDGLISMGPLSKGSNK